MQLQILLVITTIFLALGQAAARARIWKTDTPRSRGCILPAVGRRIGEMRIQQ